MSTLIPKAQITLLQDVETGKEYVFIPPDRLGERWNTEKDEPKKVIRITYRE